MSSIETFIRKNVRAGHITTKERLFFAPPPLLLRVKQSVFTLANTRAIHRNIRITCVDDLMRVVTLHSTLYLRVNFELNRAAALIEWRQLLSA